MPGIFPVQTFELQIHPLDLFKDDMHVYPFFVWNLAFNKHSDQDFNSYDIINDTQCPFVD